VPKDRIRAPELTIEPRRNPAKPGQGMKLDSIRILEVGLD
jgi:hypothetical protein